MAAVDKFQRAVEELPLVDATADGLPAVSGTVRYTQGGVHAKDTHGAMNLRDGFARNTIPFDLTVPADVTWFAHDFLIADTVEVLILNTGEALVL